MNPFLSNISDHINEYDNLETQSSNNESDNKKFQELSSIDSFKVKESKSDGKISEFNCEPLDKLSQGEKSQEKNPTDFKVPSPMEQNEEKKKKFSKAFLRFKKRYSANDKEEGKRVKRSEKIKNIVAMLERQIKGEIVEENNEMTNNKEFLDKRNTASPNEILMLSNAINIIRKKKKSKPCIEYIFGKNL